MAKFFSYLSYGCYVARLIIWRDVGGEIKNVNSNKICTFALLFLGVLASKLI